MGQFIEDTDLAPFATIDAAKAAAMIEDAESTAILIAPCVADLEEGSPKRGAVKAILRGAVLRWHDAGSGALQQVSAGPFQQSIQVQSRRSLFWPSEIEQLQSLCKDSGGGKAFAVDTAPGSAGSHLPWCNLMFGANYCSCGADIAGVPIYEGGTL